MWNNVKYTINIVYYNIIYIWYILYYYNIYELIYMAVLKFL